MTNWPTEFANQKGFSLIELAIALIVMATLAASTLGSFSGQQLQSAENQWQQQADQTLDTLYGFAIRHGRLPCPARATLASSSDDAGNEDCTLEHGVLPWRTLALAENDPWGQRLSYYARNTFTGEPANGARAAFELASSGNANIRASAASSSKLADKLPAVLVSHGPNGAGAYRSDGTQRPVDSSDEAENADDDLVFVSHLPDPAFDDHVLWIIPDLLASRMLRAGLLP